MSFSVTKKTTGKRLAPRRGDAKEPGFNSGPEIGTDIYIMPYTERSFVVMGDTLNHSNALVTLGGKYNTNLRIGQGWIFAKVREESVRNYIQTGEIVPYQYSKEDQARFEKRDADTPQNGMDDRKLREIFREFREAFDDKQDYEGSSIIDVIYQLEEKFVPKKSNIKASTKNAPTPPRTNVNKPKRLARRQPEPEETEDTEEEGMMDDEDEESGEEVYDYE